MISIKFSDLVQETIKYFRSTRKAVYISETHKLITLMKFVSEQEEIFSLGELISEIEQNNKIYEYISIAPNLKKYIEPLNQYFEYKKEKNRYSFIDIIDNLKKIDYENIGIILKEKNITQIEYDNIYYDKKRTNFLKKIAKIINLDLKEIKYKTPKKAKIINLSNQGEIDLFLKKENNFNLFVFNQENINFISNKDFDLNTLLNISYKNQNNFELNKEEIYFVRNYFGKEEYELRYLIPNLYDIPIWKKIKDFLKFENLSDECIINNFNIIYYILLKKEKKAEYFNFKILKNSDEIKNSKKKVFLLYGGIKRKKDTLLPEHIRKIYGLLSKEQYQKIQKTQLEYLISLNENIIVLDYKYESGKKRIDVFENIFYNIKLDEIEIFKNNDFNLIEKISNEKINLRYLKDKIKDSNLGENKSIITDKKDVLKELLKFILKYFPKSLKFEDEIKKYIYKIEEVQNRKKLIYLLKKRNKLITNFLSYHQELIQKKYEIYSVDTEFKTLMVLNNDFKEVFETFDFIYKNKNEIVVLFLSKNFDLKQKYIEFLQNYFKTKGENVKVHIEYIKG